MSSFGKQYARGADPNEHQPAYPCLGRGIEPTALVCVMAASESAIARAMPKSMT